MQPGQTLRRGGGEKHGRGGGTGRQEETARARGRCVWVWGGALRTARNAIECISIKGGTGMVSVE